MVRKEPKVPWTISVEREDKRSGVSSSVMIGEHHVGQFAGDRKIKKGDVGKKAANTSGLVIYLLKPPSDKEAFSRVAYDRSASNAPTVEFQDQLAAEITKARREAEKRNSKAAK